MKKVIPQSERANTALSDHNEHVQAEIKISK